MEHDKRVVLIHGSAGITSDIANNLQRYHEVDFIPSDATEPPDLSDYLLIVVDVDLADRRVVEHLRDGFKLNALSVPRLFVLNELKRRALFQVHSLGCQDFVVRPLRAAELLPVLRSLVNNSVEEGWNRLSQVQQSALKVSLKVFEDMMENAFDGEPLPASVIQESCKAIVEATAHGDLDGWAAAIRDHHNYTFRHSMLVCGFLVSFAHMLGIRGEDLQKLAVGGILHDIGKAFTPLHVLDKPGPLDDEEWDIMRRHPSDSRKILEKDGAWDAEIIDAAAHHHERVDGKGYPDGLKGSEVSDFARMVAIADVFSALVDKRTYKPRRDGKEAFELMLTMEGQLDIPLVQEFEPIALGRSSSGAAQLERGLST